MIPTAMSVPIRVLAIGNAYPPHHLGGYEIIWQGAMRHLRDAGHPVRVLTTGHRREEAGEDDDPDVHRELDWYWRDHQWRSLRFRERLGLERRNAERFDHHVAEFRPDVITWWPVGGMSLGLIERARLAGIPAVLFVLDYWPAYGPEHDLWIRTWARLGPLTSLVTRLTGLPASVDYATAGDWVFCSQSLRRHTQACGLQIPDGVVISPGADSAYLNAAAEVAIPAWQWRLLYVGRVVEQKGVHTAIESLPELPAPATLRIVGDGDAAYREELVRIASRLGVRDRVQLEPARARDELIGIYRAADAVLFPVTWDEPWGLVPLEAMALQRPVVATGLGGSGEYLVDGENVLMFAAGNASSLAAALERLAGDSALRERLRSGGLQTARLHTEASFNRQALVQIGAAAAKAPPGRR